MISLIGFVESIAVAQTLAAKRGEKIRPDQELIGLGSANISSAFSGGYPVAGGFARSVVNFDAGAATPAAGLFAAVGIAATALFLTPYLAYLPQATLAATIIVAVLSLLDFSVLKKTWHYNRFDFIAVTITLLGTLVFGVEAGVFCGVIASLILHIYKSSRPHIAVVGKVAGTEHFRNVERHGVVTHPEILSVRVDESLYFANISYFEDRLLALLDERPSVQHVIVLCTAVNEIDLTALEVLEMLNETLYNRGISLNLSEVKGPVMDTLSKTDFPQQLTGKIFLSQHQAVTQLGGYSYTDAETYVI
jgi:SulP family sulfate permease